MYGGLKSVMIFLMWVGLSLSDCVGMCTYQEELPLHVLYKKLRAKRLSAFVLRAFNNSFQEVFHHRFSWRG